MPNKTIYIKDEAVWQKAKKIVGKKGLSTAIQGFLEKFVEQESLKGKAFERNRMQVDDGEHIAFDGRLIHTMGIGDSDMGGAVFETKAGKLLLILGTENPDTVSHYEVYDNLHALADDPVLAKFQEERVEFLNALAERLGQEWADIWID